MARLGSSWVDDLEDFVRTEVAGGFRDAEEIAESAVEQYPDESEVGDLAARLVEEAIAAHLEEQATWPEVTDCDRLDAALDELTTAGIVCRQNFTCCGTCGHAEIGGEMNDEEGDGLTVRGYAFYHMQDTDRAVAGGGVYLKYGAVEDGDEPLVRIGAEIAATLRQHGLQVEWNGQGNTTIHVPLDWKRRRDTDGSFLVPDNSW